MRKIPPEALELKLKEKRECARKGKECKGCLHIHHAIIHKGRQLNEVWALQYLCEYHHSAGRYQDDGAFDAELSEYLVLKKARPDDLEFISSNAVNYKKRLEYLKRKYEN